MSELNKKSKRDAFSGTPGATGSSASEMEEGGSSSEKNKSYKEAAKDLSQSVKALCVSHIDDANPVKMFQFRVTCLETPPRIRGLPPSPAYPQKFGRDVALPGREVSENTGGKNDQSPLASAKGESATNETRKRRKKYKKNRKNRKLGGGPSERTQLRQTVPMVTRVEVSVSVWRSLTLTTLFEPSVRAKFIEPFIPRAVGSAGNVLVTKISEGSFNTNVLTRGSAAESELLQAYSSGKMREDLKKNLLKNVGEDIEVELTKYKEIRASEEDFDWIRKEVESYNAPKKFPPQAKEITFSSSPILSDESKVVNNLSASETKKLIVEKENENLIVKSIDREEEEEETEQYSGSEDGKTETAIALPAPSEGSERKSESSDSDDEPFEYTPIQTDAIIGRNGGRVEFDGCVIEIPEGAMKENMFFTFTLIYDDDEDPENIKLTPTLKCLPSYKFEKAVTITLPTCYLPDKSDVEMTARTNNGNDWIPLGNVPSQDKYSLSFEAMSFCRKDVISKRSGFNTKRMLFKCNMVCSESENPTIKWQILNYMGQSAKVDGQKCFLCEVKSGQNLILKLTSPNISFDHEESVIDSSEIFRGRTKARLTKIKRCFTISYIDTSMMSEEGSWFDVGILDQATGEELRGENIHLTSLTTSNIGQNAFLNWYEPNGKQVVVCNALQSRYDNHLDDEDIYQIVQKPKARVLFLFNTTFPSWPPKASLSQIEPNLDKLRQLFEGLGCSVKEEPNLSAGEMLATVKRFSKNTQQTDFCVLFIISHGGKDSGKDVVFGKDGESLTISEIVDCFFPAKCSSDLLDKPKLLFFHCCRGGITDTGVRRATPPELSATDLEPVLKQLLDEYVKQQPDCSANIPRSLHIVTIQSTSAGCACVNDVLLGVFVVTRILYLKVARATSKGSFMQSSTCFPRMQKMTISWI
ncbi:unnamed protein product [Clavelina lepadiformis]|uniref:Caspase family p20 domain-containing protein n=1 Tax=Clavelina lepadiformis TaxID=159417 RepID=A0ABP0FS83_CLALP